jgi:hypothetical protein
MPYLLKILNIKLIGLLVVIWGFELSMDVRDGLFEKIHWKFLLKLVQATWL